MLRPLVLLALVGCETSTSDRILPPAADDTAEAADPCAPTDAPAAAHAPSQHRGRPEAGLFAGPYDPRLAGCTVSANGVSATTYDALGRQLVRVGIDSRSDYTWSDDGCLLAWEMDHLPDQRSTERYRCDNHGYPVCVERGDRPLEVVTNTYDGEDLVRAEGEGWRSSYRWEDGKVVWQEDVVDDTFTVTTTSWEGDTLVGYTRTVNARLIESWSATLDDLGRVATITSSDGDALTRVYEGDSPFPARIVNADGVEIARYVVECP